MNKSKKNCSKSNFFFYKTINLNGDNMLFIKGLIIGLGKILPGVSGSLMAISMKVYEPLLESINSFFKNPKKNIKFLLPILSGIIVSIIIFSKIISILLKKYYFPILLLFIGLIIGSIDFNIKEFKTKKIPKIIIFTISFTLIILINKLSLNITLKDTFFTNILLGIIEAISTIIPGISGTAIFIVLKKYEMIINMLSNPISNINILIPFLIGIIIGIILITKSIIYISKKHPIIFIIIIKAFTLSTLLIMYLNTLTINRTINDIIIGEILLIIGCILSKKMNNL